MFFTLIVISVPIAVNLSWYERGEPFEITEQGYRINNTNNTFFGLIVDCVQKTVPPRVTFLSEALS